MSCCAVVKKIIIRVSVVSGYIRRIYPVHMRDRKKEFSFENWKDKRTWIEG